MAEPRVVSPEELPAAVQQIPADMNPLEEGILMQHQIDWIADDADLKLGEKGRRTGITWAEANDDTLIAAASRSAGGDNIYYIGDTKEKGLEFIGYCAHFARFIEGHSVSIYEADETIEYADEEGDQVTEKVATYRITMASGYKIAALASRPAVIRGLQGIVVIDEAAFHANVRGVIDACNALLIWGGKIRIISTHNGILNAFNELVKETHAGKWPYSLHHITFDDACANGLYKRVCLVRGWEYSEEGEKAWYDRVRRSYGTRKEAEQEELDVIPREGAGKLLALAQIEACMTSEYTVVRWAPPEANPLKGGKFVDWPEVDRRYHMENWLREHVEPLLNELPDRDHFLGEDFAMRADRTSFAFGYVGQDLARHVRHIVEMKQCPYDQQRQSLYFIGDRLPRFRYGILDANGNGMALAQEARQYFGLSRILELMPNDAWLKVNTIQMQASFESRGIKLPKDQDVRDDLMQFQMINGVGKIPREVRTEGTDGGKRHADSAVAILNFHAATFSDLQPSAGESVDPKPVTHTPEDRAAYLRRPLVHRPDVPLHQGGPRRWV